MRLLIVDDSSVIRARIQRIQEQQGADIEVVGSAGDGEQALELFAQTHPDVVTMDLTMPGMDGMACIEKLFKRYPEVKILVVSAISDKETGIDALLKGAQGFLFKPFTDAELKSALNALKG